MLRLTWLALLLMFGGCASGRMRARHGAGGRTQQQVDANDGGLLDSGRQAP